ncbi:MAG: alkaline phosphatase [Ahrensia sp.]|nr:alkaline phosphatase [Ahrensia sp.]
MKTTVTAALVATLSASAAFAQDLPQAGSDWYTSAQAVIQEKLAAQPITKKAKNVILFVADGNGVGTNYAIRLFDGQSKGMLGSENVLPYETYPYTALIKTYNINAQTPDSAPTAGSMNTGVKQIFNTINLSEAGVNKDCASEEGNKLTTFSEIVTGMGKSVGIVSTARITHATPAAVYAKTADRNWEGEAPEGCTDIAQQLFDAMSAGTVDLAFGGGARYFAPKDVETMDGGKGRRIDGRNLIEEAQAAGAQYAYDTASFNALKLDGSTPVLGLFEDSHMKYEYDRADEDEPSLTDLTKAAIEQLSQNGEGFYLEIESGRVDHANHAGNAYRTLTDGQEFAKAVALADELTDDEDTLIIVTADHEHAIAFNGYCGRGSNILGLCMGIKAGQIENSGEPLLGADGKPYTVIGYLNGAGAVMTEQADGDYFGTRPNVDEETATDPEYLQQALIPMSSETHSGEDVVSFAKGPWAHLLTGTLEQNVIFHVMHHAVTAE